MNNIYLVGMMGSGKSTAGPLLAEILDRRYIEIDQFIVESSGQSIADIFSRQGEPAFRRMESDVLREVSSWDETVISTGGGIVTRPENIARMKETGTIVYLKAQPETLWARVRDDPHRPLLKVEDPKTKLYRLYEDRQVFYEQAHVTVETDGKRPETIAKEVLEKIENA